MPSATKFFINVQPMNSGPALPVGGEPEERRRPPGHTIPGHGNKPAGKKWEWKEKWMDGKSLATIRPSANSSMN